MDSERPDIRSVLLLGEATEEERALLERRFPAVAFRAPAAEEDVASALDRLRPEAVFSIPGSPFAPSDHQVAASFPSVQWVHVGGSGYDHVQPMALGKLLTHSPGLMAGSQAATIIGTIIALNGHLPTYLAQQARHVWRPHPYRPIQGRTLLVVGLGRIGTETARLARGLGMQIIGVKRRAALHPDADRIVPFDRLHKALGEADIVSVHLRPTPETRCVFDRRAFGAMRAGTIFVNTARGAVVDEVALAEALRGGHLAAAHLDVFEAEPLPEESPLWDLPNLLITPHAADNIAGWPRLFADAFAENLQRWQAGEALVNTVADEDAR